jgi:hypothetical protein
MRAIGRMTCICILLILTACEKSGKLLPLLPDAPPGWSVEGQPTNQSVSGLGYSSMRSYIPSVSTPGSKIQRVKVQILVADKDVQKKDLSKMFLGSQAGFWEQSTVNGFKAADSFTVSGERYSMVVYPSSTTYVQIIAYSASAESDNDAIDQGEKIVKTFADKINFTQIAALK